MIELKSTGQLIDELITTTFKLEVNPSHDNIQRYKELDKVVSDRLGDRRDSIFIQVTKLRLVLRQCWDAQEMVRRNDPLPSITPVYIGTTVYYAASQLASWVEAANAGIQAMTTNRERNKLIREIDEILGELNTPLTKTY